MHIGRYRLGDEVGALCLCLDSSSVPTDPDACPTASVYDADGAPILSTSIPIHDKLATTGLFCWRLFLNEQFSAGQHLIVFRWVIGGIHGSMALYFDILPGGSGTGQVVAMASYETPHASYIVQQRTSGRIYKGKNPRT